MGKKGGAGEADARLQIEERPRRAKGTDWAAKVEGGIEKGLAALGNTYSKAKRRGGLFPAKVRSGEKKQLVGENLEEAQSGSNGKTHCAMSGHHIMEASGTPTMRGGKSFSQNKYS